MTSEEMYLKFEAVVRANCSSANPDVPLPKDADLTQLGMDSLQMVSTLLQLEETFDISIADQDLGFDTFATPESLWGLISRITQQ